MTSTFSSLSIALSGLQTQKTAMETTGHNISNANTDGYTRQTVVQTTTTPYTSPGVTTGTDVGQIGTGVEVDEITRITDEFINEQINEESQGQAYWEKVSEGISQIESILDESSDSSLSTALDDFYESLQDLSNDPSDTATRETVQERAQVVADIFNSVCENLLEYQNSLDEDVSTNVEEINSITENIAELNEEIVSVKNSGQTPNDLLDERDSLLEELNTYVDVQSSEDDKGNLQVSLNGTLLVCKDNSYDLSTEQSGQNQTEVIYSQTGQKVDIESGSLGGVLDLCDEIVEEYIEDVNAMAESFVNEFNEVHQQGYDLNGDSGGDFFTIDNEDNAAMGVSLTQTIENNLDKIAAGRFEGTYSDNEDVASVDISDCSLLADGYQIEVTEASSSTVDYTVTDAEGNVLQDAGGNNLTGTASEGDSVDLTEELGITLNINGVGEANISFDASEGNGENAIALSDTIKENELEELDNSSLTDYYESIISSVGVEGEEAENKLDNQEAILDELEEQQDSVSGVSLDEEMANIIQYQQAYNAASKMVTTTEEMLEALMDAV